MTARWGGCADDLTLGRSDLQGGRDLVVRERRRTRRERRGRRHEGPEGPRTTRGAVAGRSRWRTRCFLVSAPAGNSTGGSRLSNGSYPAQGDSDADTADLSHRPDVPTPEERIAGIIERYGDRVFEPLSETHGRKLREECLEEAETVERVVKTGDHEERVDSETVAQGAIPLIGGISAMLDWYEGYRDRGLRLGRGSKVRGDHESFVVDMDNSLTPAYQTTRYAQLQALKRQFIGGEYPNGETVEGEFADPVVILFGLTASSLRDGGGFRPIVDHDREIRDAWKGSSGSVKRTLRYVLEDLLGLDTGDYAWHWQSEPHPGPEKAATGYAHSHPVVIIDRAAVTGDEDPADPETYRSVVAKHIAECEGAEWSAHEINDTGDSAVSVREADDIEDFAGYVSEYLAVDPDQDLLERSDEYLIFAASQWATTTQKYSRSKWATAAVKADACEQQAMDPEAEQTRRHGQAVVRAGANVSHRFECAECGSAHGIDQSEESLARHRLDGAAVAASASSSAVPATDGGEVVEAESGGESGDESGRTLAERWPSARSAGSVGSETRVRECGHVEPDTCPLCATETEAPHHTVSGEVPIPESAEARSGSRWSVGFDRPPEWKPEAVVQTASGEETKIGSPGGTAYGEITVEGAESITSRSPLPYLPPPSALEGSEPWEGTDLFSESDVRLGLVPPPELVAREMAESVQSDRRVTPKEWPSDWYASRFEREEEPEPDPEPEPEPDPEPELASAVRRSIEELVRVEGVESVPSLLGRLRIDPSKREVVGEFVGGLTG